MTSNSVEAASPSRSQPPPRPEVTLAVLRDNGEERAVELCVARVLDDTDFVILNISKDPSGAWQNALNVSTHEGTSFRTVAHQRGVLTLTGSAVRELRVDEGDSLLVCQVHPTRGRSAQSLVTVLQSGPASENGSMVLTAQDSGSEVPS